MSLKIPFVSTSGLLAPLACGLVGLAACGDAGTEPDAGPGPPPGAPAVATVELTSPIDTLLAIGWTTPFEATARDDEGGAIAATFTWSTSDAGVATVDEAGVVTPAAPGAAVISATADGVAGDLRVEVIDADVAGAAATMADPLVAHLAAGLDTAGGEVIAMLGDCDAALSAGNLVAAEACLAALGTAAADATQPDDRALLAVLLLLSGHAGRLLAL